MPQAWSTNDERQYQEIRKQLLSRGKAPRRAEAIAARTVNKHRRLEGRTPSATSQGSGNPNKRLEDRTYRELYNRARQLKIEGRSKMNKSALVKAIRKLH